MNVLVLMCDHLRYDAISALGNGFVSTPNIDRLLRKSVYFGNCYSQAPVCGPARHSLATGKYPYEHGVVNNDVLPLEGMFTIAHALAPKGYRRVNIGHMHWNAGDSIDNGYEIHLSQELPEGVLNEKEKRRYNWEMQYKKTTSGVGLRGDDQYWGYDVARQSIRQLEQFTQSGDMFLNWTSFNEPHPPFFPPKAYYEKVDQYNLPLPVEVSKGAPLPHHSIIDKQKVWKHFTDYEKRKMKASYYGMVGLADSYVGKVLDTVDRLNLWDNTMIILTSDHGEQMGDHGLYTKFVLRESSLRVPLMVYYPGCTPGTRIQLVEHVDLFPTICEYTGAAIPEDVRGKSLWPLLRGLDESSVHDHVYSQIDNDIMVRTDSWKLNIYEGEAGELFDLKKDPNEGNNLIDDESCRPVVQRLMQLLKRNHPSAIESSKMFSQSTRLRAKKNKHL